MITRMVSTRRVNLSGGEAAFPFAKLAESVFRDILGDLHRYYISDLSYVAIPTPEEAIRAILPHLMRREVLPPTHLFPDHLKYRVLLLGSGTTEGFEHVLRVLKYDVARENETKDRAIDPVILMPVPSYGYFLQQAEFWGIRCVPIRRRLDDGGRLAAEDVQAAFERLDRAGKRVVAFYDCNPHNPLGLIRDRAETEALAAVFREINA
ncbi:MAG: aminotransferase class I/II-fold pyridoxal phosphate-dependent enzyme, partial [Alphaproteobacteria bacterium]|nr:aminotransferase class I/II-fold pyridoxal phosphate-dependent enzyme [Alphaproteobacteria bacterium]